MNKKGEVYFNWIFIMIVGAIFLVFFAGFAVKYKDLQEKKNEIIILDNLNTALINLQSSSFVTSINVNLPLDVNVACKNKDFIIFINEENKFDYILASKDKLKNKMYVWYQPYEIPFRVTNFYYLTDDEGVYLQTDSVEWINNLILNIPDSFKNKIHVNQGKGKRIDINGDLNSGVVTIDGTSNPYLGKEMLYAAIFSNNYTCFYGRVQDEIDNAVLIYKYKASLLSGCGYNNLLSQFESIQSYDDISRIEQLHRNLISGGCLNLF